MPVGSFEYRSDAERVAMERAIAFVAQMHDLALNSPLGQVLEVCEQQALGNGRDLLRETMQQAVQASVHAAEEKKGLRGSARAGSGSASNGGAVANC
jgi:hypothetical protein